jgi:hypothetical protein
MSENLPSLFTTQFSTMLALKLQQKQSKLRGRVHGRLPRRQAGFADPVLRRRADEAAAGPLRSDRPAGRRVHRRWVFPVDRDCNQLIDTFDKLKTAIDPQSQEVAGAAAAVAREWDDRLIAAAFGTTQLGTDGAAFTAETWASISSSWTPRPSARPPRPASPSPR